ncbi:MAG: U32 family peptidase [Clostridiaceae bacterium]|nr:U32 family peptidase [Eubacteriales bacterium]
MELLSPAGSRESLVAAVQNGADAVYFGGGLFNARRNAANFEGEALREAIAYCRLRGVKTYVTLNTLLFDKELGAALPFARLLYLYGADAVIVQDLGLVSLLKKHLPGLTLHASTQMGVHDVEGARMVKRVGAMRAVLAREVPLKEISIIAKEGGIEIETFAHGAMCMSFSGGCLFSSMAGERSGNRGTCAQPCRKRIRVNGRPGENDYQLSLSDLCLIGHLGELKSAGVACVKIEGRMKRAEYVAAVTRAYRMALDGADIREIERETERMLAVFNRGGVRTGYYFGDGGVTDARAASAEPSESLLKPIRETYAREERKREAVFFMELHVNDPAILTMRCGENAVRVSGEAVQRAHKPMDASRVEEQLKKLGGTAFACTACEISMDENAYLPVSAVNSLRREACAAMEKILTAPREAEAILFEPVKLARDAGDTVVCAKVKTEEQARAALLAGAQELLLEPESYGGAALSALESLQDVRKSARLLLALPAAMLTRAEHERVKGLLHSGLIDGAMAQHFAQYALMEHLPVKLAGPALNAMNAHVVAALYDLGFSRIALSLELTKPQMRDILVSVGGMVQIYGRAELMQLFHCPVKEHTGCNACKKGSMTMVDGEGRVFPLSPIVQESGCLVRMLNCDVTDITDLVGSLPKPEAILLAFYNETPERVAERVRAAKAALAGGRVEPVPGATRGHFSRAVE